MRRFLLLIGVVACAAAAQVFWLHPMLDGAALFVVILSAFFVGLICYWAGVCAMLAVKNVGAVIGFSVFFTLLGESLRVPVIIERLLISQPVIVSLAGAVVTAGMWVWLGRGTIARRHCTKPWIGFFDAFNRDKVATFSQARSDKLDKAMSKAAPWVEEMFINLMGGSSGTTRSVWASVYTILGPTLSLWKQLIPFVVIMALTVGYMGRAAWFMFVFMPVMPLLGVKLPVYSTMLIAAGRRERYIATLVNTVLLVSVMFVIMLIIAGLQAVLAPIVPPITIKEGVVLTLKTIDVRCAFIPLVIMPLAMTMHLVFYRSPVMILIFAMVIAQGAMFAGIILRWDIGVLVRPELILAALAASWLIYVLTLRWVCRRRCLVGQ